MDTTESINSEPSNESPTIEQVAESINIYFEEDFPDVFEGPSIEETLALVDSLRSRLSTASIKYSEELEDPHGIPDITFELPCQRNSRSVTLSRHDDYKNMLDVDFEKIVFLSRYDAIVCYEEGWVEARIRSVGVSGSPRLILSHLKGMGAMRGSDSDSTLVIYQDTPDGKKSLVLGTPSKALLALSPSAPPRSLSLRLDFYGISQHDKALDFLIKTADSLFLQIDLLTNLTLGLVRERKQRSRPRIVRSQEGPNIQYPTTQLDVAPASLYWYARAAMAMPLLQFLAFYQVIEFYYPIYAQAEARRKLQLILKDPSFRTERDADIGRILSVVHVTRSGGLGDERAQLKATLMECLSQEELKIFLTVDKERAEFFKKKAPGLTDHKLPLDNEDDLRAEVANRIYDIRCKIVHTKADSRTGELELLLPFSKEADLLNFDIELVQYISQKVLIAASSPMH